MYVCIYVSMYLCIYLSINLSIYLYLCIYLYPFLDTHVWPVKVVRPISNSSGAGVPCFDPFEIALKCWKPESHFCIMLYHGSSLSSPYPGTKQSNGALRFSRIQTQGTSSQTSAVSLLGPGPTQGLKIWKFKQNTMYLQEMSAALSGAFSKRHKEHNQQSWIIWQMNAMMHDAIWCVGIPWADFCAAPSPPKNLNHV